MEKILNIALVGAGRIADLHAPAYLENTRARLYAVCDVSAEVCQRRKIEWGLERTYTSYDELLADPQVDAVEILTPHHLHCPMVLQAARAGKHVSVQKPMAVSLRECQQMIDACREAGVKFKVFENFVFYPAYARAKEILASGAIGEPLCIRTRIGGSFGGWEVPLRVWAWRLNEAKGGGGPLIFDDGYHKFSLAYDFFGPVENVTGWIDRSYGVLDCPAALAWKHESGVLGYMDATLTPNFYVEGNYYSADERVEITGTKGMIHIGQCSGKVMEVPPLMVVTGGRVEAHTDLETDWLSSFTGSAHDFIAAVLEEREPHLSGERGRDVMAFVMAAHEASRRNGECAPAEIFAAEGLAT